MTARKKPLFFSTLALCGILLGGFGAAYSLETGIRMLGTHDQFVQVELPAQLKLPPELGSRDQLTKVLEREAGLLYSRRGAALPLAALNLILSVLLFAGSTRALAFNPARPQSLESFSWGISAWRLAAFASFPYLMLDAALSAAEGHDMQAAFAHSDPKLAQLISTWLGVRALLTLLRCGGQAIYFAICLQYLKPERIARLFPNR